VIQDEVPLYVQSLSCILHLLSVAPTFPQVTRGAGAKVGPTVLPAPAPLAETPERAFLRHEAHPAAADCAVSPPPAVAAKAGREITRPADPSVRRVIWQRLP